MKLIIKRAQAEQKGLFGGHKGMKFTLSCQVDLSDEERGLLEKYNVEEHPLTYRQQDGVDVPALRIGDLVRGRTYEVNDVSTLLNNEEVIKNACHDFKMLLEVMRSFGGEEVVEI